MRDPDAQDGGAEEWAQVLRDHFFGKPPEGPVLASFQAAVQVRQAQLSLGRKVELTNRIAIEARALGRAVLDVAGGNYGYSSVLGSTRLLAPLFVGMLLSELALCSFC